MKLTKKEYSAMIAVLLIGFGIPIVVNDLLKSLSVFTILWTSLALSRWGRA